MESIEQWMWFIAGILITSILVVITFSLLSNHAEGLENGQARESFNLLTEYVQEVCMQGKNFKTTKNLIFPQIVKTIRYDSSLDSICMTIQDQDEDCKKISVCDVTFNPPQISLIEETSFYGMIQKAIGKRDFADIKFEIIKDDYKTITVNWN